MTKKGRKPIALILGQIDGEEWYEEIFALAERALTRCGRIVLNPARLPKELSRFERMHIEHAMLECADEIYTLPNTDEKVEWIYREWVEDNSWREGVSIHELPPIHKLMQKDKEQQINGN